jgi:hypothetical protein
MIQVLRVTIVMVLILLLSSAWLPDKAVAGSLSRFESAIENPNTTRKKKKYIFYTDRKEYEEPKYSFWEGFWDFLSVFLRSSSSSSRASVSFSNKKYAATVDASATVVPAAINTYSNDGGWELGYFEASTKYILGESDIRGPGFDFKWAWRRLYVFGEFENLKQNHESLDFKSLNMGLNLLSRPNFKFAMFVGSHNVQGSGDNSGLEVGLSGRVDLARRWQVPFRSSLVFFPYNRMTLLEGSVRYIPIRHVHVGAGIGFKGLAETDESLFLPRLELGVHF